MSTFFEGGLKVTVNEKLEQLRTLMKEENIDVYYIPSDDFHGSEFVSDYFKEREYMSGFTGSAGTLIVTMEKAVLYTDGRYFLQAEEELKDSEIELYRDGSKDVPSINEYLGAVLNSKMTLGFDGRCMTAAKVLGIQKFFESQEKEIQIQAAVDLPEKIWTDRPKLPDSRAFVLRAEYSGKSYLDKLVKVRDEMKKKNADTFVLTSLDDIAWLLNIRGDDVKCSPLVLSNLLITRKQVIFYCGTGEKDDKKLSNIYDYLISNEIVVRDYFAIYEDLTQIEGKVVLADFDKINFTVYELLKDRQVIDVVNPTTVLKAVKNQTEIKNMREAHIKDAVAYVRFLKWFKEQMKSGQQMTELDVAAKLLEERSKMEHFVSESFEPIVAYGAHGAIVHYSPDEDSNCCLGNQSFVLIDTGAHFLEGTTDITRTLVCTKCSEEERQNYTLVLKGNLALGSAVFKQGTTGSSLDMLARKPLWDRGMDYNHGTGHGVGYLLNVHEGPNAIRYRVGSGKNISVPMKEGMITSNEPGLYLAGKYGIRIENMILCKKKEENEYGTFLEFETLTLVPFDLDAIDKSLLSAEEITQINDYHRRIYHTIGKYLSDEERKFLKQITAEI